MKIVWERQALADFRHFEAKSPKLASCVVDLIADIKRDPFRGLGKPEPLKFDFAGYWSRRIDREHRLVYQVEADTLTILKCRWHCA